MENGVRVPDEGKLYYRGIRIQDLVDGFISRDRFGFEEIVYLLLTGELPDEAQLDEFHEIMSEYQILPEKFKSGIIMKMPSDNIMSMMEKCVLSLHAVDPNPDDTSIENVMRQSLELIARFPAMAVYSYQASLYFRQGESMVYHRPDPTKTIAENFLIMLRPDGQYTQLEARLLDLALVLHAEHGGGNNSAFTVHVVTSSGTDTYSAIAAALGSLKGPKHGGANLKVMEMFDDLKKNVPDWKDEAVLTEYLRKLLDKEGFDRSGLIYGMGHAVYSVSDPRAEILKSYAEKLSIEKGCHDEFQLYADVERIAKELITAKRKIYKGVCANIDLYSGFVYKMLGIPTDLYTPLFAIARIAGWSAHRIEELINSAKIIRPAYLAIREPRDYVPMDER
jgi:citrate synthase